MTVRTGYVAGTITFSNVDGPGNRFAIFLQGCNFDCVACHNPQTIPHAEGTHFEMSIDELLVKIRRAAPFIRKWTNPPPRQKPPTRLAMLKPGWRISCKARPKCRAAWAR